MKARVTSQNAAGAILDFGFWILDCSVLCASCFLLSAFCFLPFPSPQFLLPSKPINKQADALFEGDLWTVAQ